ncbi:aldehyde dehydrogenase [Aspergillus bombycis]|uniref:aldehyde dehydrogenase (NAD(+)) n=1 Tax=Aspergillus bombycis TaxID=109264 RepID=A0A1F8ADR2_9EURO|nr:aldehyde dehydrogenase [Aspergillus bombycis]OGM49498.1 aldehyde dehydrogenase [Aspergillus bombycis]
MTTPEIETRLFIDGEFVPALDGSTFKVTNPFTGETVAEVSEAKADDVNLAVESAKRAFPTWSGLDGSERRRLMLRLADLVDEHAAEFARLEALSMGKPVSTYMDQVMGTATLRYYAGKALDIHGATSLTSKDHLNISIRQPYGVTGAIIPWNVPVIMICFKVGPALIAGNTLVLKSSEKAPLTSLLFARLAKEAGFPPGVLNVLSGFGLPCGDAIARHMDIRKIAFTGSTRTGKLIQKAAVDSNLKSCTLELGGKSPLIVFEDADLQKAAKAAAFSIVFNSGQVCMASSRVYVQDAVADEFKTLYAQAIEAVAGQAGNPLEETTRFGPQADEHQFKSISNYLQKAQDDGLQRLSIEKLTPRDGVNFVSPVVLQDVPEGHSLMKQEIFGFVLAPYSAVSCLNTFSSERDVIRAANDSEYGLYASVFTRDINRAIRVAKYFEAGSIGVNTSSPYYCQDLPLGGFKGSGTGRELGDEGLEAWTEVNSIYISLV